MERSEWHTERQRRVGLEQQHMKQLDSAKGEKGNETVVAQPSSVQGAKESTAVKVQDEAEVKVNAQV